MKIYCPCDKGFYIEHNPIINLDKEPDIITKILEGNFLTFKCPQCGQQVKPEIKTRIEWDTKNLILLFIPEADRFACLSFCAGLKQIDLNTKKEINAAYLKEDETPVIGYRELAERIKLLKANFDITAIEALKFFIIDNGKDIENKNVKLFFNMETDDGNLQFYVYGLKKDEVAVMNVPKRLYENLLNDIKQNKNKEIIEALYLGKYISYQNIYTKGREK